MNRDFKTRYLEVGRSLSVMGFSVREMNTEELHAIIGFLLDQAGEDSAALLAQEAPLGAPYSDPPKNDGLLEG